MRALVLALTLSAGCSRFFTPPCVQVSRAICQLPDEGDACAFVLDRDRSDDHAQQVCKDVLPAAQAFHDDRSSADARAAWTDARAKLVGLGMQVDPTKGRIENKLKAAGGTAGRVVQQLEDANELEEDRARDETRKVLDDAAK